MDTFTIVKDALAASAPPPTDMVTHNLGKRVSDIGRITDAVQRVVDALTPPDGGRYIVGFAGISTAQTSLSERRITVSDKPLNDFSLTLVEKAVVIATFAAHEIGHTRITRPRGTAVKDHNPSSGFHAVANLADDIILEPFMVDLFPILRDAFEFTGGWVLRNGGATLPLERTWSRDMKAADRFNLALAATRYGDIPEIIWEPGRATRERDWYRGWAARLLALRLDDHAGFIALCDEAWRRMRLKDEPEPIIEDEPTQPTDEDGEDGEDGEPGDEQGEDEGPGGSQPGEGKDDGEPEGEPEDGEGGSDEGEDGDGEGEDEGPTADGGTGEPEDGEDEGEGEGKGNGPSDGPAPDFEEDEDESNEDPADDSDGPGKRGDADRDGGGGNAEAGADDALEPEEDFDKDAIEKSMHDSAESTDGPDADAIEEAVRSYRSTGTTTFGRHGTLVTRWD